MDNIKDFVEIHKIRHHQLEVDFEENIENLSQEISPLILIQFVENAFKYGAVSYTHLDVYKRQDET